MLEVAPNSGRWSSGRPRRRRWLLFITTLALLALAADLSRALGPSGVVRPLVGRNGWEQTTGFSSILLPITSLEAPEGIVQSPDLMTWRSWTPTVGGTTGELRTSTFLLPDYMAVPYIGFPGEVPGNRIVLRCELDGREIPVASLRTNTQWATVFLHTAGLCHGPARLIVSASDRRFYVGVATPFEVTAAMYYANTQFGPRVLVVVLTWAVLVTLAACFALLAVRLIPAVHPVAGGFVGVGVVGMTILTAFMVSAKAGVWSALAIAASAAIGLGLAAVYDRDRLGKLAAENGDALLLWLGAALIYTAFVSAADSGGGSWAVNGLFTPLRWSSDNQQPMLLAEALFDGTPRNQIAWGPWLASDRGPLLAALLTVPRILLVPLLHKFGSSFMSVAYMMAGITVLASWTMLLHWFCREAGIRRMWIVAVLALASPFLLFNTVYSWPKLLGAAYVVVAFLVLSTLSAGGRQQRSLLIVVALCAVLACLAHASNAFALVPLALFFLPAIWRAGPLAIVSAALAAALVYLPWAYWQVVIQPGGNALVRFALTGDYYTFNERQLPLFPAIIETYDRLGFAGWLAVKAKAMLMLFGAGIPFGDDIAKNSPGTGLLGWARILDLLSVLRALGASLVGCALLLWGRRMKAPRSGLSVLDDAALIGSAGLILTLLVTLPPPILPSLPYGSMLLLWLAGVEAIAIAPRFLAAVVVPLAVGYFLVVWIAAPLSIADRLMASSLTGMIFAVGFLVIVLVNFPTARLVDR